MQFLERLNRQVGPRWALVAVCFGLLSAARAAADDQTMPPIKVLFLGSSPDSTTSRSPANERDARYEAFRSFVEERFPGSEALDRDAFEPGDEAGFDVVVLDWRQSETDLSAMGELVSPLGPREQWTMPTVLLGSSGLLIAGPWELPGSWG